MALKNIKQELHSGPWAHWIGDAPTINELKKLSADYAGVDYAAKADITVVSMPCGNCGVYRMIDGVVMEKCPNCGDDETDLSLPTIYDQEREPNANTNSDQDPEVPKVS